MPLYCTMVNACGQIGGYPIPSYRIPVAYVEHAEVPSALSARPSSWPDGRGLRNTKGTVSVCRSSERCNGTRSQCCAEIGATALPVNAIDREAVPSLFCDAVIE